MIACLVTGAVVPSGAQESVDPTPAVRRLTGETVAEVGRTRFIAFEVTRAPRSPVTLEASVRGDALRLIEPPRVEPGAAYAYARIAGVRPGSGTLNVAGARMTVHVIEPRAAAARPAPRITGPADGAVVWGGVMAGVELLDPPSAGGGPRATVQLLLPDGSRLDPTIAPRNPAHPHRRFGFRLEADALQAGAHRLTAIATWPDGRTTSSAVTVRWITPGADRLLRWETEQRNTRERPARLGKASPQQGVDMRASGGRFSAHFNAGRSACVELDVPKGGGWYQMIVTAAGQEAAGGLPTIGIYVDNQPNPVTNGRITAERWHRAAIGLPVFLAEGPHHLSPVFVNGFYGSQRVRRALYLDHAEVVRLDGPASRTGAREAGVRGTSATPKGMPSASAPVAATPVAGLPPATLLVDPDVLRVAFTQPYAGDLVPGGLQVRAVAQWAAGDAGRAPEVTLLLNGAVHAVQRAPDPRFYIDAPQFAPGTNTLQLVARLDSGAMAFSPVQTVHRKAPKSAAAVVDAHRFHVHDTRWGAGMARRLRRRGGIPGHSVGQFAGNGAGMLSLPLEMAGRYRVWLEARGQHFQGAPKVRVSLVLPGAKGAPPVVVGKPVDIRNYDADHTVGDVTLPAGPKQLRFHFFNDQNAKGTGDRRVWIRAARLMRIDAPAAAGKPQVSVTWPRASNGDTPHRIHRADVVVCEVSDDRLVRDAILLLDGKNTGVVQPVGGRTGRVVLPVPAAILSGAPQTLSVLVRDYDGGQTRTPPIPVQLQREAPAALNGYARAVRLCNRFGYGPEPEELAAILTEGEAAWLDRRLAGGGGRGGGAAGARDAAAIYFPSRQSTYHVGRGALHEALVDPNPVRARFRAWVENHFTTWIRKTQGPPKAAEHARFSELGVAPFGALLRASAHSPAMLRYLDQTRSYAGRLNENYARELLELHTLGVHGGYSQADVTKLSAILTGWTASVDGDGHSGGRVQDLTFRYEPLFNDARPQTVIGYAFPEADGPGAYRRIATVLELLTAHPATARFISGKLVGHYVAFPAPPKLVEECAQVYLATHGDLAAVLRFIARHPTFWDPALPARLTSPYDYGMRLSRASGYLSPYAMGDFLDRSGMGIFDRETPDGYPEEDQAWADSNALLQRWKFAEGGRWALARLAPSSWRYQREAWTAQRRAALVDVIAQRLTGLPLGPQSRDACVELLAGLEGTGNNDRRTQEIAIFIARMPEANLR
jgi:uncharacterized protein (DUF1800 family)